MRASVLIPALGTNSTPHHVLQTFRAFDPRARIAWGIDVKDSFYSLYELHDWPDVGDDSRSLGCVGV